MTTKKFWKCAETRLSATSKKAWHKQNDMRLDLCLLSEDEEQSLKL